VNWFRFWSRAYVLHLEDEILWLRKRLDMERNRAEVAIDNLVNVRLVEAGRVPVTPTVQPRDPDVEDTPRTPEEAMRRILADPEFHDAGNAG
jgi:hypothetical protein